MAEGFIQERKKQKSLIIVLVAVLAATIIVIWQGFSKEEEADFSIENFIPVQREIKINFEILGSEVLKNMQLFTPIEPLQKATSTQGSVGRENPFIPYQ